MQMFPWVCFGVVCCIATSQTYNRQNISGGNPMDTILPYREKMIETMVEKFSNPGKEGIKNPNYNSAFAAIIDSLKVSKEPFCFLFDTSGKSGAVRYDGKVVSIYIIDPKNYYGTIIGMEGILFEEVWHAKQFLDGQIIFQCKDDCKGGCPDTSWRPATNIWMEVEAKKFVISHLEITVSYSGLKDTLTELYYMKYFLPDDFAKAHYLIYGGNPASVKVKMRKYWPSLEPLYPEFWHTCIDNPFTEKTKTGCYYAYPRRRTAKKSP